MTKVDTELSPFEKAIKRLSEDMQSFIDYCESTDTKEWCTDIVRSKGYKQNCLYGHLVNWYYGKNYEGNISPIWDAFEEVGTTFYVYPINDGQNPNYPQTTAKERCIAYLKNVRDGKELWSAEAMELEMKKYQANLKIKEEGVI